MSNANRTIDLAGTQILKAADGTAAAPSITNDGDLNTGMFFPAADTIAFAEGGAEAMRIDSSGQVGINLTSGISEKLHVAGNIRGDIFKANRASAGSVTSVGYEGQIDGTTMFGIYSPTSYTMAAYTSGTERLRIDSSGNVGIGLTNPDGKLAVAGTLTALGIEVGKAGQTGNRYAGIDFTGDDTYTDFGFRIIRENTGQNANSVIVARGTGNLDIGTNEAGPILFRTTATERLRINSSGHGLAGADNAYTWGGASNRWSVIYSATGSINTSDINSKKDIAESTLGIDFIKSLNPVSYKFKVGGNLVSSEPDGTESVKIKDAVLDEDGNEVEPAVYEDRPKTKTVLTPVEGKRTHWGFVAQEVKAAADAAGVDFGGWVKTDTNNPDSEEGLRYDQFISPLTKALQEAIAKIETLEAKVAALEAA